MTIRRYKHTPDIRRSCIQLKVIRCFGENIEPIVRVEEKIEERTNLKVVGERANPEDGG
jgi:hypothetical protein